MFASMLAATCLMAGALDLSNAVVMSPDSFAGPERKAVQVLLEEVEHRSGLRLPEGRAEGQAFIRIGVGGSAPDKPEAYAIETRDGGVTVTGRDSRGVLFGVGHLLRTMQIERGKVTLEEDLNISTSPAYPLRGHQLGYRPKTNSYDAWTPEIWDQYIRDLAIFGTNAIELLPPKTDDAADSPHYPLPPEQMLTRMSQICADYGLDVWMWYPALEADYTTPENIDKALKEWEAVLSTMPRLDAVFVPGGDPGHTEPRVMMNLLEKQAKNLRKTRPNLQMWMSPQGFDAVWMKDFLDYMKAEQPKWLTGIVFGPQNRMKLKDLRRELPAQYPIRHYPDITHSMQCQFPVPQWDYAYATTEQRECINPRPTQFQQVFNIYSPATMGFISYSEGCNDDVNKILWSAWGWDPKAKPEDILREYARYYISAPHADAIAHGILSLEKNWVGPLLANEGVMPTLESFQALEKDATPQMKLNWRFQQLLYRAYYDAYIHERLVYETQLEDEALESLRANGDTAEAREILDRTTTAPVAQELRARVFELAEALYQSIRMQLSVPKYQAIHIDRGANLDLIDVPLNDRNWLTVQFDAIDKMEKPAAVEAINRILNWTDPGPGGFYDDLGQMDKEPHLVRLPGNYPDPEYKADVLDAKIYEGCPPNCVNSDKSLWNLRRSWNDYAETKYDAPLRMHYGELDPKAPYKVRVTYCGDSMEKKMQLVAGARGDIEIHPYIDKLMPVSPIEFALPSSAYADGTLDLAFTQEPGFGGNGRGNQVAEIWIIKE